MDLITKRMMASDIGLSKRIKNFIRSQGLKEEEAQVIRKGIVPEDVKFKERERSSVDYITTRTVDRDGEIVVPGGAILDHYRKNPVVLFAHDYKSMPIGKSLWIKSDEKGLISKTQYAKTDKANEIYEYRKAGFPMAKSIGFIPLKVIEKEDFEKFDMKEFGLEDVDVEKASRIFPEWLMLEYSDVPVPSNPDALQLAISKGILTLEEAERVANEENAFVIKIRDDEDDDEKEVDDILEKRYGKDAIVIKTDDEEIEEPVEKEVEEEMDEKEVPEIKSAVFKDVDGISERWNKGLSKTFDASAVEAEPSTALYSLLSKWLECEVRDIFVFKTAVPSPDMGSFLSGLEEAKSGWTLQGVRNFNHSGTESPPIYEVIQLTSEKSGDFLVSGIEFLEKDGDLVALVRTPTFYGIRITAYTKRSVQDRAFKILGDAMVWAKENNFLKGEAFSLSGEFIKRGDEDWAGLFLKDENSRALKSTARLIDEKKGEFRNRGVIMMGPPGTGKTLSGRVLKDTTDATFIWVSARDFSYSGAIGGLSYAFRKARELSPSILFIEDIDNWLHDRATDLVKTEMDGIARYKGVLTILTSNYPEKLPPALIDRPGRFHDVLSFDLPDKDIRSRMIHEWTSYEADEDTVQEISSETDGMSGAHIYEVVEFAKVLCEETDGLDINSALKASLKKVVDQRSLISSIRNPKPEEKLIDNAIEKVLEDVEEKAGRAISKKTRSLIESAISAIDGASDALKALVEDVDSNDQQEQEGDTEEEKMESGVVLKENDDEKFVVPKEGFDIAKRVLAEALKDVLRSKRVTANDIVKDGLDKVRGRLS